MSNIIDFLARVGADASLRSASSDVLGEALTAASVEGALGQAVLAHDGDALRARLSIPVFCSIQMKEDEEDNDDDDKKDAEIHVAGVQRRA